MSLTAIGNVAGYELYSQIHQNYWNRLVHTVGMPFAVYGFLRGAPALIGFTGNDANMLQLAIFYFYIFYYMSWDFTGAVLTAMLFYPSIYFAFSHKYKLNTEYQNIIMGFGTMILALLFQEIIGHCYFEESNSILIQIPNNILIAPIFAARSLLLLM